MGLPRKISKPIGPKKYLKSVKRRETAKSLLNSAGKDMPTFTTLGGYIWGLKKGHPAAVGIAGWMFGKGLQDHAERAGIKLDLRTIAEASGRPVLAKRVHDKIFIKNRELAKLVLLWGKNGPRMNAAERKEFLKKSWLEPREISPADQKLVIGKK